MANSPPAPRHQSIPIPRILKRYHELGFYARVAKRRNPTPELRLIYGNLATFRTKNQAWSPLLTGASTSSTACSLTFGKR